MAIGIAACGGSDSSGDGGGGDNTPSAAKGGVKIAFPGTLSGPLANYAKEERQGLELAMEEMNAAGGIGGSKVTATFADDRGKPENAIVIAQRLCSSDSSVVLGFTLSTTTLAPLPALERCQMPVLATSTTSPKFTGLSDYFFRAVLSDTVVSVAAAKYAIEQLGAKRVAVMYQKDDYGEGGRAEFVKTAKAAGADIVYDQGYQTETTSFLSQLTKIKSAKPDVIFLASFYPEAARIAQQAKQLRMDTQLLGLDGVLSPELINLGGDAVDGMQLLGYFNPEGSGASGKAKTFVEAFKKKYGTQPSDWSALQYDAAYAVKQAAEKGGGNDRAAILKGLPQVEFEGVTGTVAFDENGDRKGQAVIFEVKGGKFVPAPNQLDGT
jgi:branched-chain amino acid transport system substrate-binding protein